MAARTGTTRPKKPTAGGTRTSSGRSPWDVVPGTHADERLGPFFAVALFSIIGTILHRQYDESGTAAALVVIYFLIAAGVLGWLAWRVAHGKEQVIRVHLGLTVGAAFASLGGWTVQGWTRPWADGYFLVGFTLAASWLVYTTRAVRDASGEHNPEGGALDELVKNAARVKVRLLEESDDGVRKKWQLTHRGATTKELQAVADQLASHAGTPEGSWRFVRDSDDAGRSTLTTVAHDLLGKRLPYPGPSAPGESCFHPSRVGIREDGTPLEIVRPGDPATGRPNLRILISGMPNAGKTVGELAELIELVTRKDVVIWWVDVAKPWQTLPAIRPAIDWAIDTDEEVEAMVKTLRQIIRERARILGQLGYTQWVPECWEKHRIPFLVIHFEEMAQIHPDLETYLIRAGEQVRSAGISVSLSLQRASYRNLSTDLRSQLGVGWSFGQKDDTDAAMVLSESTIANGAAPEVWTDKKPGYTYLEQPFDQPEAWATPGRTYDVTASDLFAVIKEWAPKMTDLDPTTAAAAGPAYAARSRVDMTAWIEEREAVLSGSVRIPVPVPDGDPPGPVVTATVQEPGGNQPDTLVPAETGTGDHDDDDKEPTPMDIRNMIRRHHKGAVPDLSEDTDNLNEELAPAPDHSWGPTEEEINRYTPEERAEAFRALLARLHANGIREITMSDLGDMWDEEPQSTGKPPYVYWRVSKIVDQGLISYKKDDSGERARPITLVINAGVGDSDLVVPEREPVDDDEPATYTEGEDVGRV